MFSNTSKLFLKAFIIFLFAVPASIFLHEVGHWIVYKFNDVDCWFSLQRVNLTNPTIQISDSIFLKSLFGGPAVTLLLSIVSYIILVRFPQSMLFFILGIINSTARIIPTIIAFTRLNRTDLAGFSDEGNIVLRISDNLSIRLLFLLSVLTLQILIFTLIYKKYKSPSWFSNKKMFVLIVYVLSFFVIMLFSRLDKILFGL